MELHKSIDFDRQTVGKTKLILSSQTLKAAEKGPKDPTAEHHPALWQT